MLVLAVLILLGPPVAALMTGVVGFMLLRHRPVLGGVLIGLLFVMAGLLLWEFRYDLGIYLPEINWLPSGASSELTMAIVAALALIAVAIGFLKGPKQIRFRILAGLTATLWVAILIAGSALSQVNFSH